MNDYLVTGGAGFIGGHIARRLTARGHNVTVVDNMRTGDRRNIPPNARFFMADVSSPDVETVFDKPYKAIFHFAGQSSVEISYEDPLYDLDSNCRSTLRLLDLCMRHCPDTHFIYASTMSVYGDTSGLAANEEFGRAGMNFYAIGKKASEDYISLFSERGLCTTSVRLFNIYGPGQNLQNMQQGMLSIYLSQAFQGCDVKVKGSLSRTRDFLFIEDLLNMLDRISGNPSCYGQTFNMCSGLSTSVKELIECIGRLLGKNLNIIECTGTPGDIGHMTGDPSLLQEKIGIIKSTSIDEGINRTISAYLNKNYFSAL